MPAIKTILIMMMAMLLSGGCVDPFNPPGLTKSSSLVVDGLLTDQEGYHYVRISRSSSLQEPLFIPETNCQVEVISHTGNTIRFHETNPGLYRQWIDNGVVRTGESYMIRVITNSGTYESGFETMLPCAPIGEVDYLIQEKETDNPEIILSGIQFYTDLYSPQGFARNYRWEMEETWEYHSEFFIRYYWDGKQLVDIGHDSDSLFYCWSTLPVREIFSASMQYITGDSLKDIPLIYVSNETDKLKVRYSLLIKQYSLDDEAYRYWDLLRKLNQETGGLYETQPPQVRGNIHNINDEEEIILGNFNVSAMKAKRIFVDENFRFFPYENKCSLWLPIDGLGVLHSFFLLHPDETGNLKIADPKCFDCTLKGGTTIKPEFW